MISSYGIFMAMVIPGIPAAVFCFLFPQIILIPLAVLLSPFYGLYRCCTGREGRLKALNFWQYPVMLRRRERARIVDEDVRIWAMKRSVWADQDLEEKRRPTDEFMYGMEEGLGRRGWVLENGDLAASSSAADHESRLQSLPAELRLMIYANLDFGSCLTLHSVSRFFRNDRPEQCLEPEMRATYVFHAETVKHNKDRLACFACLRLRDMRHFSSRYREKDFRKFGVREYERMCRACEFEAKRSWFRALAAWLWTV